MGKLWGSGREAMGVPLGNDRVKIFAAYRDKG